MPFIAATERGISADCIKPELQSVTIDLAPEDILLVIQCLKSSAEDGLVPPGGYQFRVGRILQDFLTAINMPDVNPWNEDDMKAIEQELG